MFVTPRPTAPRMCGCGTGWDGGGVVAVARAMAKARMLRRRAVRCIMGGSG